MIKVNNTLILLTGCLLCMFSCKHTDKNFREVTNPDVTIQLTRMQPDVQGEGLAYKFRVIPSKAYINTHNLHNENFYYHMDSCFYTETNGIKTYAALVQPIANGMKGNYEYLLQFDAAKGAVKDSVKLVYDDRYITQKKYDFKIQL